MTEVVQLPSARTAANIGQVTAIEQARAVAEVAAAVQVAQQFPRNLDTVRAEMAVSCASYSLAKEAFYAVKNRGQGSSVHLARELAAIYGNFQSGVHELRRDDNAGISEIQAFAWDIQRNTRSTRTFIVPHQRMKDGKRMPLVDLQDVYLNNQNIGARALRECIFAALPKWLVREAEQLCRDALEKGDGVPLATRAENAVATFKNMGVTEQQLVDRLDGRRRSDWTPRDLASLEVVFGSLQRGDTTKEEEFTAQRVTASEITQQTPAAAAPAAAEPEQPRAARMITKPQSTKLHATLGDLDVTDRDTKLKVLTALTQRPISSSSDLTQDEAKVVIDTLDSVLQREDPKGNLAFIIEAGTAQADAEPSSGELPLDES